MYEYIEKLKAYVEAQTPNYGVSDAKSILEMLYYHYNECNGFDDLEIKEGFEDLYLAMDGMSLREMDKIVDAACSLCRSHQKNGFIVGIQLGFHLAKEINECCLRAIHGTVIYSMSNLFYVCEYFWLRC